MIRVLLLIVAMLLMVACNPCKPGTARCNGSVVEICKPNKKWSKVQDCNKLKRTKKTFKCTCLKPKAKCFCKVQLKRSK